MCQCLLEQDTAPLKEKQFREYRCVLLLFLQLYHTKSASLIKYVILSFNKRGWNRHLEVKHYTWPTVNSIKKPSCMSSRCGRRGET